jgi:hypothetical protein
LLLEMSAQDLNELEKEMQRKKGLLKKLAARARKDRKEAKAEAKAAKAAAKAAKGAGAPSGAHSRGGGGIAAIASSALHLRNSGGGGNGRAAAAPAANSCAGGGSKVNARFSTPRGAVTLTSTSRHGSLSLQQHAAAVPQSSASPGRQETSSPLLSPPSSKRAPHPRPGRAASAGLTASGSGGICAQAVVKAASDVLPSARSPKAGMHGSGNPSVETSPLQRSRSGEPESTNRPLNVSGRPREGAIGLGTTHTSLTTSLARGVAGRRGTVGLSAPQDDALSGLASEQPSLWQQHHEARPAMATVNAAFSCAAGYTAAGTAHSAVPLRGNAFAGGTTRSSMDGGGASVMGGLRHQREGADSLDGLGSICGDGRCNERPRRTPNVGVAPGAAGPIMVGGFSMRGADLRNADLHDAAFRAEALGGADAMYRPALLGGEPPIGSGGPRDAERDVKREARELAGRMLELQPTELGASVGLSAGDSMVHRVRAAASRPAEETSLRKRYTDAAFTASALSQPHLARHGAASNMGAKRPWDR